MNIFEESLAILSNKAKIRKLVADMHSEDLRRIIERIEAVYRELLDAEQAKEAKQEQKKVAIAEIKEKLKEMGLSVNDLGAQLVLSLKPEAKQKRQYKQREKFTFQYETKSGELKHWTGATVGRKPNEFSEFLERTGKTMEECIIQDEPYSHLTV